jgi:hypothetical protein
MPKMAEKGRHSNGAIGSRWRSAQRPRNATMQFAARPAAVALGYRKGGPPNVSQETTGRAFDRVLCTPHAVATNR